MPGSTFLDVIPEMNKQGFFKVTVTLWWKPLRNSNSPYFEWRQRCLPGPNGQTVTTLPPADDSHAVRPHPGQPHPGVETAMGCHLGQLQKMDPKEHIAHPFCSERLKNKEQNAL